MQVGERVRLLTRDGGSFLAYKNVKVVTGWAKSTVGRRMGHFRSCRKAILEATIMHASINGARITNGVKAHLGIVLGHEHMVERNLRAQWSRLIFYVQVRVCRGFRAMSGCDRSKR